MNENDTLSHDPSLLNRLLEDDELIIMENLIPFCQPPFAKALALQIKAKEIQKILTEFDDDSHLKACGLLDDPKDMEQTLKTLKNTLSKDKAEQIDQILHMMEMMKMYQKFMKLSQDNPELFSMFQSLTQGDHDNSQEENGNGDASKKILELLSATQNNGKEFQDILSLLFNSR